ncbi:MAG: alpha/beta hydrolase family protein [Clostridiales bacterium]|nr:alpha/beta hydrolase family protein [Clostridiales bacterium]
MAYFEGNYYSLALMKQASFRVFLPNDALPIFKEGNPNYERPMKTLYLLHGFSENERAWMNGSSITELAIKYNLAVVMPCGDNSFYLDQKGTGRQYATYVGKELVEYMTKTFHLSDKREDTFIGGLSMGGFGAIHTGYLYHDTFSKVMALSSALIVNNIKNQKPGFVDPIADYDYYTLTFGDLSKLEDSVNNPAYLVKKAKEEKTTLPELFMAVGTEDFLLEENREFHRFLKEQGIDVNYYESTGVHDWKFWDSYLEPGIKWMLGV